MEFTHLDPRGQARMVDVTGKQPTVRSATAVGRVTCSPQVLAALRDGTVPKGDVLAVARVAGIAAAKRVPDLLPLAHVIGVHGAAVDLEIADDHVAITATVQAKLWNMGRTQRELSFSVNCVTWPKASALRTTSANSPGASVVI